MFRSRSHGGILSQGPTTPSILSHFPLDPTTNPPSSPFRPQLPPIRDKLTKRPHSNSHTRTPHTAPGPPSPPVTSPSPSPPESPATPPQATPAAPPSPPPETPDCPVSGTQTHPSPCT